MVVDLARMDDRALKDLFLILLDKVDTKEFLKFFKEAFNENHNNALAGLYLENYVLYQEHSKGVSILQNGYDDLQDSDFLVKF